MMSDTTAQSKVFNWNARAAAFAIAAAMAACAGPAHAEPSVTSPWATEHATRVRLMAGPVANPAGGLRLMGGVEIQLDDGWKTYWRNPGSSGVPPRLEWTGSENLADVITHFPAPQRFPDREGDTIGYKSSVMFPVDITPVDPTLPIRLKLSLEYGVCKDVCIPVQPTLELTLMPEAAKGAIDQSLATALDKVPRKTGLQKDDPALDNVTIDLKAEKPLITIEATFPNGGQGADVFLEAPDGIWIPLAKETGQKSGAKRTFTVDLTDGADVADLKGKVIRLTLRSDAGSTDTSFKFE